MRENTLDLARRLHQDVPVNWYEESVKKNWLQRYWHQRRATYLSSVSESLPGKVLDIGSADGYFSRLIQSFTQCNLLVGIEALEASVDYATRRYKDDDHLFFEVGDAHNLQFDNNYFDAVYIIECLEHVPSPGKVLKEIHRVLKPGGYVVILVPNENWLFRTLWPIWENSRGKVWKGAHLNEFNPNDLGSKLFRTGFTKIQEDRFILDMLLGVKAYKNE